MPFTAIADIFRHSKLHSLMLALPGLSSAPDTDYVLVKHCQMLQYLSLNFCSLGYRSLCNPFNFLHFPHLKSLRLEGSADFIIFILQSIAKAPKLAHLSIIDKGCDPTNVPSWMHHSIADNVWDDLGPHLVRMLHTTNSPVSTFNAGFPERTSWGTSGTEARSARMSSGSLSVENAQWTNELMKCMPGLTDLSLGPSSLMLFLSFFACEDTKLHRARSTLLQSLSNLQIPSVSLIAVTYVQKFLECRKQMRLPILQHLLVEDVGLPIDGLSSLKFDINSVADLEAGLSQLRTALHVEDPDRRLVMAFEASTLFQQIDPVDTGPLFGTEDFNMTGWSPWVFTRSYAHHGGWNESKGMFEQPTMHSLTSESFSITGEADGFCAQHACNVDMSQITQEF